ncbi:hypothetical protein Shyhy01_26440 [Streptomyces hygroscopicus subsp. hygroscopicus]|nr:hypothetical protein [Streptomyces hygroscopicus]GLX49694.1 hypothetical protein Shyhy01_26440 [Streptomyces hygroscopicus subsp. hygroscopicus]
MGLKNLCARVAVIGSSAVLASGMAIGEASATSTNIDYWSTSTAPVRCARAMCLYYSPGAEGAIWQNGLSGAYDLGYWSFYDDHAPNSNSSAGAGQAVRNNAASAENGSVNCTMSIYVYPGGYGDVNVLDPGRGGNLTSGMRNNEASVNPEDWASNAGWCQ